MIIIFKTFLHRSKVIQNLDIKNELDEMKELLEKIMPTRSRLKVSNIQALRGLQRRFAPPPPSRGRGSP